MPFIVHVKYSTFMQNKNMYVIDKIRLQFPIFDKKIDGVFRRYFAITANN